jgi:hypothetical protein
MRTALARIVGWTMTLPTFVENIEAIVADEQQVYWRNRGTQAGAGWQTGPNVQEKES